MEETLILNEHNKQEYPPMHTAEHLLNGEMARRYGHGRAFPAHIERKKSREIGTAHKLPPLPLRPNAMVGGPKG